ncbi:hypothetical protein JCM6882_009464 [Rhodosporidiobolus microsporus]
MGDLHDRFGLLHLGSQPQQTGSDGQAGGLGVPEQGVRKQRSQRFTVPTSPPRTDSSLLPTSPSSAASLSSGYNPAPPSLPYQPPPPPVQTQTIPPSLSFLADPAPPLPQHQQPQPQTTSFYSSRQYSSSGSSSGGEASPQPAYQQQPQLHGHGQQYRPHTAADFLAPTGGGSGGGGSAFLLPHGREASPAPYGGALNGAAAGQGAKMFNEEGEEIIETAIVIKSIPFIAVKEQLLGVMVRPPSPPPLISRTNLLPSPLHPPPPLAPLPALLRRAPSRTQDSLRLPPPFAFNFHFDQGQFRGLAFANYRDPAEAAITVSALNGFEFMGRKLRAEFKRALKPGEKEAIERNKAIKRMRSAQLLASAAPPPASSSYGAYAGAPAAGAEFGIGPPAGGWNRREASAPGGYPGYASPAGQGVIPPVPSIPLQHYGGYLLPPQHQQQQDEEVDYGRPLLNGAFAGVFGNGNGTVPSPAPSALSAAAAGGGVNRSFASTPSSSSGLLPSAMPHHSLPHTLIAPVPQPPAAPAMEFSYSSSPPSSDVGTSVSQRIGASAASGASGSGVGTAGTSVSEGEGEEGGSAVGVGERGARGRDDLDLNDPLTLDLYSRILLFRDDALRDELAFARTLSTQQRRIVHLVAKKLGLEHGSSGEGEARRAVVWKKGAGPVRDEPRRLRQTVSSAAIRRAPSAGDLLSSSPAARGYNSSSPFASRPTSAYLSASPSSSSLATLAHNGGASSSSYHANLRGKKSMPDIRYSRDGHILSTHPNLASYSSSSSSRSPSPAPPLPLPQSTSLAANLAAYSSGSGYAPPSSNSFGTPVAAQKRRSYASLRTTGGGGWDSPGGLGNGSNFATVASIPHSFSSSSLTTTPTRGGASRPSVQSLFASASPSKEDAVASTGRNLFWASSESKSTPGKAEPVRMPSGPGAGAGSGAVGDELEWRKR